ncbi:hypothetical protein [Cellulomonas xiejunii]|uniref:hypothetical protein n=1 Tax=Cellulomonas xiejunii TaxID=2968083 RepID=UPI001D0E7A17|nr:hypothetical protein [Cellulomonas xiejunii]MCC2314662.1 hypothetical protein [Cellulomonas xiejunii]
MGTQHVTEVDVVVEGGGMLAAYLARGLTAQGMRVALTGGGGDGLAEFEPTIPSVSFTAKLLAKAFDVDLFERLAHVDRLRESCDEQASPLAGFGFSWMAEQTAVDPDHWLQLVIPGEHDESVVRPAAVGAQLVADCPPELLVDLRPRQVTTTSTSAGARELRLDDGRTLRYRLLVRCLLLDPEGAVGADASQPLMVSGWVADERCRPDLSREPLVRDVPWTAGSVLHTFPGGFVRTQPAGPGTHLTVCVDPTVRPGVTDVAARLVAGERAVVARCLPELAWFDPAQATWEPARLVDTHGPARVRSSYDPVARALHVPLSGSVVHGFALQEILELAFLVGRAAVASVARSDGGDELLANVAAAANARLERVREFGRLLLDATTSWEMSAVFARLWFAEVMFSAISIRGVTSHVSLEPHTPAGTTQAEPSGAFYPVVPQVHAVVRTAARAAARASRGQDQAGRAAAEVYSAIRASRAFPPIFGFGDPAARTYRLTLGRRLRTALWLPTAPRSVHTVLRQYRVLRGGTGERRVAERLGHTGSPPAPSGTPATVGGPAQGSDAVPAPRPLVADASATSGSDA